MADTAVKQLKRSATGGSLSKSTAKITSAVERQTIRTGKTAATREAAEDVAERKQTEAALLAESEDEVARRTAVAQGKTAGRTSLIKSRAQGLASNLGGT